MFVFSKYLILVSFLFVNCQGIYSFWWGSSSEPEIPEPIAKPSVRQLPVSYIKAFAYQPVAFPSPLAPITTYQVSKNGNQYTNGNQYSNGNSQYLKSASPFQQYFQSRNSVSNPYSQFQNDYSTSATQVQPQITQLPTTTVAPTTTTSTTTTPIPSTTQQSSSYFGNPYSSQSSGSGSQSQYPYSNYYENQPNNYGWYNRNGVYQFYTVDPSTYQFIPTNVGQNSNGQIRFVPCMCPIGVSVVSSEAGEKNQNFVSQQNQNQQQVQAQQQAQVQQILQYQQQQQSVVQQPQQPVVQQVMYPESSSNSLPQSIPISPASPSVSSQSPERPEESVQL